LSTSSESQWNVDSNDVLSVWKYYQLFTHEWKIRHSDHSNQWGCKCQKIPKSAPSFWGTFGTFSKTLFCWMPGPTPLTIPNGIQIHSAVLTQYTSRTDRQTDTQTDRWAGDRSVTWVLSSTRWQRATRSANKIKLETVSIAEPLQNWQHAQTIWAKFGMRH